MFHLIDTFREEQRIQNLHQRTSDLSLRPEERESAYNKLCIYHFTKDLFESAVMSPAQRNQKCIQTAKDQLKQFKEEEAYTEEMLHGTTGCERLASERQHLYFLVCALVAAEGPTGVAEELIELMQKKYAEMRKLNPGNFGPQDRAHTAVMRQLKATNKVRKQAFSQGTRLEGANRLRQKSLTALNIKMPPLRSIMKRQVTGQFSSGNTKAGRKSPGPIPAQKNAEAAMGQPAAFGVVHQASWPLSTSSGLKAPWPTQKDKKRKEHHSNQCSDI